MIKGHVTVAGTMDVDGERLTGVFVECPIDELRNNSENICFKDVVIIQKKDIGQLRTDRQSCKDCTIGAAILRDD